MAYVKTTWAHDTKFTTTNLNNAETQYDVAYGEAVAHNHDDRYYTRTECDGWFWNANNDGTGSGCDADLLYYASGNKHYSDFGAAGISSGSIIMWDSAVLPAGWYECNGSNGTPDLRDKFVVGAGGVYGVGGSIGANLWSQNYNLTVAGHAITTAELPSHRHDWTDGVPPNTGKYTGISVTGYVGQIVYSTGNTASAGSGGSHGHTSSTVTINWTENKPPCVALYYIMKS